MKCRRSSVLVGKLEIRVERNRAAALVHDAFPVELVEPVHGGKRFMRFGEIRCQRDRARGFLFGAVRPSLALAARSEADTRLRCSIGKTGMSGGVARIDRDRRVEF